MMAGACLRPKTAALPAGAKLRAAEGPFEQQKKNSQAFSRRPRGSTINFLNLKSGEIR